MLDIFKHFVVFAPLMITLAQIDQRCVEYIDHNLCVKDQGAQILYGWETIQGHVWYHMPTL